MFSKFIAAYHPPETTRERTPAAPLSELSVAGYTEFMSNYSGLSLADGLYRVHELEKIEIWNQLVSDVFTDFPRRFSCFGFDWLGNQFALDRQRSLSGEPAILMFDAGSGEVLEVPATFASFHNDEIVNHHNAALASDFFDSWSLVHKAQLGHTECAGYKVPLFLGGKDVVENLEVIDMEVYWNITGQLWNKTRELPPGTTVGTITIS